MRIKKLSEAFKDAVERENNANMRKPSKRTATVPATYENAVEEDDKLQKNAKDVDKELRKGIEKITPKSPEAKKSYKKTPYTEKYSLSEDLEDDRDDEDENGEELLPKNDGKVLNEGPGAGYSIKTDMIVQDISDLEVHSVEEVNSSDYVSPHFEVTINCNGTATGDLKFDSYYYGGEANDKDINISQLIVAVYSKEDADAVKSEIANRLDEIRNALVKQKIQTEIIYGGGWMHSEYDGTVAEGTDGEVEEEISLVYEDGFEAVLAGLVATVTDEATIAYIDKVVTGDNEIEQYEVYVDGEVVEAFDNEEEAIEYAKKNRGDVVEKVSYLELENGDWDNVDISPEVVWERDYDKVYKYDDEVEESLKPARKKRMRESLKFESFECNNVKLYNRFNYTIQELKINNDDKTFERGNFTIGKPDKTFHNGQAYERFIDDLVRKGYKEIPSDYRSVKRGKGTVAEAVEPVDMTKVNPMDLSDEGEKEPDDVFTLVYDRLAPVMTRYKPEIATDEDGSYSRDMVLRDTIDDYDIAVRLDNPEQDELVKKVAAELHLDTIVKTVKGDKGKTYHEVIVRIPEEIANMNANDYVKSLGRKDKVRKINPNSKTVPPRKLEAVIRNDKGGKLDESAVITCDLSDYTPWGQAVETWEAIGEADKIDSFDNYLVEVYPEGIGMTELNDLLAYEGDFILKDVLGING